MFGKICLLGKKKNVSTNLTLRTWNSFFIFLDLSFRYHTTLFVLATVDEVGVICEAHCEHLLHCQQFAHAIYYTVWLHRKQPIHAKFLVTSTPDHTKYSLQYLLSHRLRRIQIEQHIPLFGEIPCGR